MKACAVSLRALFSTKLATRARMVLTTAHNETGRGAQSFRAGHKSESHLSDRGQCRGFGTQPMFYCWCSMNCQARGRTRKVSPLRYSARSGPVVHWASHETVPAKSAASKSTGNCHPPESEVKALGRVTIGSGQAREGRRFPALSGFLGPLKV